MNNSHPDDLQKLSQLECLILNCGGKLLRGPRGGMNQNVTCRSCRIRYNLAIISNDQKFHSFQTDAEFRNHAVVIAWEYIDKDNAGAAYYDPTQPTRNCDFCNEEYTGPAVYCCLACALADA